MYISFEGNLFFKEKLGKKLYKKGKLQGEGAQLPCRTLFNTSTTRYFSRDSKRGLKYFCRKNVIWMVEILVQGILKAIDEQEHTMFTVVRVIGV
jgi:hypothetical protein